MQGQAGYTSNDGEAAGSQMDSTLLESWYYFETEEARNMAAITSNEWIKARTKQYSKIYLNRV